MENKEHRQFLCHFTWTWHWLTVIIEEPIKHIQTEYKVTIYSFENVSRFLSSKDERKPISLINKQTKGCCRSCSFSLIHVRETCRKHLNTRDLYIFISLVKNEKSWKIYRNYWIENEAISNQLKFFTLFSGSWFSFRRMSLFFSISPYQMQKVVWSLFHAYFNPISIIVREKGHQQFIFCLVARRTKLSLEK